MIKKKLLFASAFLLFAYSASNISNVDNLNTVKNVENHNVISTDFTSGSAKGRLDKFVDNVGYGKTGGLVNLPGNRFNIQMETCVNCGSVNSVFGTIDESTLCMRCNEPILVKVETETIYCVNCGEAQPKVFNFNSNISFLDNIHNSVPINRDILFDLGLTSGNSDLNGYVVYDRPFPGIGDLIGETYAGFEKKCVKCGLPVDVLMDKRICENPGCGAENIVPFDSPLDTLCKECGELIYFDLCVNCGARNVVDSEVCCNPECGESIYILMETRICANPYCGAENRIPASSPKNTLCKECHREIDGSYYGECVNCGTINYLKNDICCNPDCLKSVKYYELNCVNCRKNHTMDYRGTFDICEECLTHAYIYEKCVHCDHKLRIYFNAKQEKMIFYSANKESPYICYGSTCPFCLEQYNFSNDFTTFDANLSFYISDYLESVSNCVISPLSGCCTKLVGRIHNNETNRNEYYTIASTISDEEGDVRFKLKNSAIDSIFEKYKEITIRVYPMSSFEYIDIVSVSDNRRFYKLESFYRNDVKIGEINGSSRPIRVPKTYGDIDSYINDYVSAVSLTLGQEAMIAENFAKDMMENTKGISPNKTKIIYPSGDSHFDEVEAEAFYSDSDNAIHISRYFSSVDRDAVRHEYGHHIQHQLDIIDYPWYKGDHFSRENHINRKTPNGFMYLSDTLNEDQGMRLAWAEAWPTAFGEVAKAYSKRFDEVGYVGSDENDSKGGYRVNHSTGAIESDEQLNLSGAGCERTIVQVLWDIFDPIEVEKDGFYDEIGLDYEEWFDITTQEETYTLKDFYDNFRERYGDSESKKLDRLFEYHNIYF